jgi:hypothetical protein
MEAQNIFQNVEAIQLLEVRVKPEAHPHPEHRDWQ